MDQRKTNFWFVVLPLLLMVYMYVVVPILNPDLVNPKPKPKKADIAKNEVEQKSADGSEIKNNDDKTEDSTEKKEVEEPDINPQEIVKLGSMDSESGFFVEVELNSQGASIDRVTLNGDNYPQRSDRSKQFQVLKPNEERPSELRTFAIGMGNVDKLLSKWGRSLKGDNWKVASKSSTEALFSYTSPDSSLRLEKKYTLAKLDPLNEKKENLRETDPSGYTIVLEFSIVNLSDQKQTFAYEIDGPSGVPLENKENTRRYREIQLGVLQADGSVDYDNTTASEIADQTVEANKLRDPQKIERYKTPIKFVGVDTQYFAALVLPRQNQREKQTIEEAVPMIVGINDAEKSDLGLRFKTINFELEPKATQTHIYDLYAGPKRTSLLDPIGAEVAMNWGWFGSISKVMLSMMGYFHNSLGLPYWFAIIMLTIIVRGAMYPISHKQAVSAKRMKELQPEMNALKKKHENDKEKLAMAQLELMKKHGYSPLSGCLPFMLIFLQLPIFYGLYTGLNNSVDLRMSQFLWINDLAAPDAMFGLPFTIPFLGNEFNLLPIITVVLFVVQQKLFMPPAATEEQIMQQKMMQYFPIFIGFLFYKVQAGLCLYFIASSMWSIAERKMLDFQDKKKEAKKALNGDGTSDKVVIETTATKKPSPNGKQESEEPKAKGMIGKMFDAVNEAANPNEQKQKNQNQNKKKKSKKNRR